MGGSGGPRPPYKKSVHLLSPRGGSPQKDESGKQGGALRIPGGPKRANRKIVIYTKTMNKLKQLRKTKRPEEKLRKYIFQS